MRFVRRMDDVPEPNLCVGQLNMTDIKRLYVWNYKYSTALHLFTAFMPTTSVPFVSVELE